MKTSKKQIDDFLAQKSIALIGVSRNPQDYTRALFRELKQREYHIIPINPYSKEIEGQVCYADIESVKENFDAAIIFTPTVTAEKIIEDLLKKGIKNIWIHNSDINKPALKNLIASLNEKGVNAIQGHCPIMFLPETQFFHRMHGFFVKMVGNYPS
ncbi:MAG: CoA-binding protein [Ignavibacteriales bacterium]|nr:CoA-binding protein [Ignavibacteriales bacterium]